MQLEKSIVLPQIGWRLDARAASQKSFASHAHSDHVGRHERTLCSEATAQLITARMGRRPKVLSLPLEEEFEIESGCRACLYPAGHILGSAQLWVEKAGVSLLYTGDFKLRQGLSAEPCATPRADVLIMETTFGKPRYRFPPTEAVMTEIAEFCRQTLENDEIPILFTYSLGKSQEVLRGLEGAGFPIMLHSQVKKMTRLYESLGYRFPHYRSLDLKECEGHVIICPPQATRSGWLKEIKPRKTAMISGWALDPGAIYRYKCDAAFALSDHADYDDLLAFVERVRPSLVYTVHGFAREFAETLASRGIDARALGMDNQLMLPGLGV
ncbi:MAG: MBL fold metallo-hydrolase RNA specificity domain-containing protein [Opitutales bacterium]